ncbi:hypothetical protein KUCAC02_001079 [Chaenocephalus aceratus]|uniref:Uncharacterized protein n=1 Tax=Chaenocephalus aceratus TaxID=36190 RepID=A0ACB9XV99_CHAAC|nr:hypothetical protein KUCAC02_001079 [Chaenocephalus aceratus]
MQIAVACWDVHGIRKEVTERGEQGGRKKGGGGSKGARLKGCFSKAFVFLTPIGSSSRLPGRGDGVCDMPSDTSKLHVCTVWQDADNASDEPWGSGETEKRGTHLITGPHQMLEVFTHRA